MKNKFNNGDLVCYDSGAEYFWVGYLKSAPFLKGRKRLVYHFIWDDSINMERRYFILVKIDSPYLTLISKGEFT